MPHCLLPVPLFNHATSSLPLRFATLSCPLCLIRVEEVANQTAALLNATGLQGTNFTDTEVQALFALDRVEDFANLIMLGEIH